MSIAILVASHRTGTHAVGTVIDSSPEVTYCGEVFHGKGFKNRPLRFYSYLIDVFERTQDPEVWYPQNRIKHFDSFVGYLQERKLSRWLLVDVKYNHLHSLDGRVRDPIDPPEMVRVIRKRGIPVIHLRRRNLVRQLVSKERARATGTYTTKSSGNKGMKVRIDVANVRRRLNELEENSRMVEFYFEKHKPLLNIYYEDVLISLSAGANNTVSEAFAAQINSFLQLEHGVDRTPRTVKLTPNDLSGAVENYHELAAALTGTNYEHMLADR